MFVSIITYDPQKAISRGVGHLINNGAAVLVHSTAEINRLVATSPCPTPQQLGFPDNNSLAGVALGFARLNYELGTEIRNNIETPPANRLYLPNALDAERLAQAFQGSTSISGRQILTHIRNNAKTTV